MTTRKSKSAATGIDPVLIEVKKAIDKLGLLSSQAAELIGVTPASSRFPQVKPEDYVFPACENARIGCPKPDAGKIDPSRPIKSWRTAWRRALKDAGFSIRFHDLRHTCITKIAEGQASEQTLMSIAGHLSRKMLEHHSHIRMAAKRAALDAIAKPVFAGDVVQNPLHSPAAQKTAVAN